MKITELRDLIGILQSEQILKGSASSGWHKVPVHAGAKPHTAPYVAGGELVQRPEERHPQVVRLQQPPKQSLLQRLGQGFRRNVGKIALATGLVVGIGTVLRTLGKEGIQVEQGSTMLETASNIQGAIEAAPKTPEQFDSLGRKLKADRKKHSASIAELHTKTLGEQKRNAEEEAKRKDEEIVNAWETSPTTSVEQVKEFIDLFGEGKMKGKPTYLEEPDDEEGALYAKK